MHLLKCSLKITNKDARNIFVLNPYIILNFKKEFINIKYILGVNIKKYNIASADMNNKRR